MKTISLPIPNSVLNLLNIFFHIMHLSIIFFFLFGWLFITTQEAHFVLAVFILASWYGLGIYFGFGYCLVTDLQWKIKKLLGQAPPTEFYVKYMIDKITGLDTNPTIINGLTTSIYFAILILSVFIKAKNA